MIWYSAKVKFGSSTKAPLLHFYHIVNQLVTHWNRTIATIWCCVRTSVQSSKDSKSFPSADVGTAQRGEPMALKNYAASDIAKYILSIPSPEDNDFSNMKLQKLCYYTQALCSSMRGVPLFREKVCAWDHGPVVETLYHEYKVHKSGAIPPVVGFDASGIDASDRAAINDIVEHFGQFSAWALRNMTHDEAPWAEAYKRASGSEITVASMIDFFRPQISDDYVKRIYGEVQGA